MAWPKVRQIGLGVEKNTPNVHPHIWGGFLFMGYHHYSVPCVRPERALVGVSPGQSAASPWVYGVTLTSRPERAKAYYVVTSPFFSSFQTTSSPKKLYLCLKSKTWSYVYTRNGIISLY